MNKYTAEWTGSYPTLCFGEWILFKNGEKVNVEIPFQGSCANTSGTYEEWHFDDNWCEVFEDYEDGLDCDAWCNKYQDYLGKIAPRCDWTQIFMAFQRNDWRHGSCGGCI